MFALCVALVLPGRVFGVCSNLKGSLCAQSVLEIPFFPFLTPACQYSGREALIHLKCILYSTDHCQAL